MSIDPITAALDLINSIIGKAFPNADDKMKAQAALAQMQVSGELQIALAQIGVNAEEAKSTNWFIAGARPALLWVCVMSFTYHFFMWPMCGNYFHFVDLNDASVGVLMVILTTLIGARSYDKTQGTDTK